MGVFYGFLGRVRHVIEPSKRRPELLVQMARNDPDERALFFNK
jgi:hypothetical protein